MRLSNVYFQDTIWSALARPHSTRTLIKACLLLIVITGLAGGYFLATYPEAAAANSLARVTTPIPVPAIVTTSNTSTIKSSSNGATISITPNCAPDTSFGQPVAPTLSPDQSGLQRVMLPNATYKVYGNSASQISSQMATCTPVSATNGDRFAASTDYAINWSFRYQDNGAGVCAITNVSVGIAIAEVYPSWQPGANAPAGLTSSWQTFITSLATHEAGHAALDQATAATILADLQSLPASDCASISDAANTKANADIQTLNQANASYDSATNHGATQGAILR